MAETTLSHPDNREPVAFTQEELGWLPWLEPLPCRRVNREALGRTGRRIARQVPLFPSPRA